MSMRLFRNFSFDQVEQQRISWAIKLLGEEPTHGIYSHIMTSDGPQLGSVILLSNSYIAELRLTSPQNIVDISKRTLLINYYVEIGDIDLAAGTTKAEDGTETPIFKKTRHARVVFRHGSSLATEIQFFGPECDEWLDFVLDAYRITTLLD